MAFIPVPGAIQAEVRATYLGIPIENVLNFTAGEVSVAPNDVQNVAIELGNSWVANVLLHVAQQYVLREVFAFDRTVQNGVMYTNALVAGETGVVAQNPMPGSIAAVVSLRTGLRGRSFRGRLYLAGLTEPDVTDNVIASNIMDFLVAAIDTVRGDVFSATGYQLAVVSTRFNNADRNPGIATPVQTVIATTNRVRTQRGRLE